MALTSPAQLLLLYFLGCIHSIRPMSHYWWLTLARLCTRRVCLLKYSHVFSTVRFTLDAAHLNGSVKKGVDCATVYLWRYSNEIQTSINTNQHSRPEVWKIVSWVQGYHKSRRKHDIYVRSGSKTRKDFEAEANNWTLEKHSRTGFVPGRCFVQKSWIERSRTSDHAIQGSVQNIISFCTFCIAQRLAAVAQCFLSFGIENTDNW